MPQNVPFSFGPNTSPGKSRFSGDGRLINAFVEPETDAKGGVRYTIHADPGLTGFAEFDETNIRGIFKINSALYVVSGESLYRVTAGGASTSLGTVAGDKPVIVAINANATAPQAVIVADNTVYELQADILQTFQDADLGEGVHSVAFLDGYFIIGLRSGIFQLTGLSDTTIAALDFATAEGRPDPGVRIFTHERRMWYFGTETTEVWVNTGNATFPFERDSAFIETGCLSKYSVVAFDNTIAFVDHRARVVKFNGYTPNVISTAEVERDLRRTKKAQRSEEIEGFVWFDAGREFYVLSGPDWTWVYDASTQLWHQKKSHLSTRWIGRGYIDAFDKHLIGSIEDGNLYEMSHDYKDEDGSPLIMDLRTSILGPWPARVSWQEIAIDMEMGVGNASDADPKVMISWSDDAGATFSAERFKQLGATGAYSKSIRCNGCGTSDRRGRVIRLQCSAAVNRVVIQGNAVAEVLSS
jgi:hypothetical protein